MIHAGDGDDVIDVISNLRQRRAVRAGHEGRVEVHHHHPAVVWQAG